MRKYSIIILAVFPMILFGQDQTRLIETTKEEFNLSRKRETVIAKNTGIVKNDKTILIKLKNGETVKFEDTLSNEKYQINEYVGDLIKDKIALIKTQDYNSDRYIAVDLVTGEQNTFMGLPHVYGDNIVCLQGVETDIVQLIEFWKIRNNILVMIKSFNLSGKIYPVDIVLKSENEVIIRDSKDRFWMTIVNSE